MCGDKMCIFNCGSSQAHRVNKQKSVHLIHPSPQACDICEVPPDVNKYPVHKTSPTLQGQLRDASRRNPSCACWRAFQLPMCTIRNIVNCPAAAGC